MGPSSSVPGGLPRPPRPRGWQSDPATSARTAHPRHCVSPPGPPSSWKKTAAQSQMPSCQACPPPCRAAPALGSPTPLSPRALPPAFLGCQRPLTRQAPAPLHLCKGVPRPRLPRPVTPCHGASSSLSVRATPSSPEYKVTLGYFCHFSELSLFVCQTGNSTVLHSPALHRAHPPLPPSAPWAP